MSVQYPYRAVICGEEHIVKEWRSGNLITDKGEFICSQLHGGYPLQLTRLLEVAVLKLDESGEWLLNGRNLKSLQSLMPTGSRLYSITDGEVLRVHKVEVHAVAWVQANSAGDITELLDMILDFWKRASLPVKEKKEPEKFSMIFQEFAINLQGLTAYTKAFAGWSVPIWLTEFHPAAKGNLDPAGMKIVPAQPANVPVKTVKPTKYKAAKARKLKLVARFEKEFSVAIISKKDGKEIPLTIEPELQALVKKIVDAGGNLPRTTLRSGKSDTYQPEKLLKSEVAKSLIKAGLLGTNKSGRTTVFWAKQRTG
jgi:hypothetical protein